MRRTIAVMIVVALAAASCTTDSDSAGDAAATPVTTVTMSSTTSTSTSSTTSTSTTTTTTQPRPALMTETIEADAIGSDDRPVVHYRPEFLDEPRPLVVVLHAYGGHTDGVVGDELKAAAADDRWIVIAPSGLIDSLGNRYWAATPTCCDRDARRNDDLGYLRQVIESAMVRYPVDRTHVVVYGGSNGGFMALQLACHASDLVTAVVVVSAAESNAERACQPDLPVSVFHIHGRYDQAVKFGGDELSVLVERIAPYPAAEEAIRRWTVRDACPHKPATRIPDPLVEWGVWRGCAAGSTVEYAWLEEGHAFTVPPVVAAGILRFISAGTRRPDDLFDRNPGHSSLLP